MKKQTAVAQSREAQAQIDDLKERVKTCEETLFEKQELALYVGKFVCKVNTCQTNTEDEHFDYFMEITQDLVDAKSALAKAKEAKEKVMKSAEALAENKEELKSAKEKLTEIMGQLKEVEALLRK